MPHWYWNGVGALAPLVRCIVQSDGYAGPGLVSVDGPTGPIAMERAVAFLTDAWPSERIPLVARYADGLEIQDCALLEVLGYGHGWRLHTLDE